MSKQAVKLIAADLAVGEDSGFVQCPFCMAEHEEKFSVTRTETGLLYNCFRASCGASGFLGTGYWEADYGEKPVRPKRRPYLYPLQDLTVEDREFFKSTWGVYPTGFKVTERDEYAFPLNDARGYRKGWVIRQPIWKGRECHRHGVDNDDYPKAMTYKDKPEYSKLSWGKKNVEHCNGVELGPLKNLHIVIVEDVLSAWKVTQCSHAIGVALNGAQMGYEDVKEIGAQRPVAVSIWLDPDATSQAYKIQHKWGLSFNFCHVITSEHDPKDMSREDIKEKLNVGW